ncbi:hypothetical protein [Paraburkholderia youngii]|uniref:hypothetical protein n=1 Tax=Paraburkholderia youngii TaxID=2782701 RepID=UPI003D1D7024
MTETIRDLPEKHRQTFNLREKVRIWINNITPQYLCVVVRDITDVISPRPPTAHTDERIYEVRYLEGPFKGQYVPSCAWELDPFKERSRPAHTQSRPGSLRISQLAGA